MRIGEEDGITLPEPDTEGDEESFWTQVWRVATWRLVLAAAILLLGTGAFGWVKTILSLHLENDLGFKLKEVGLIFAVINITYSVFGPFVGALADR